MLTRTSDMKSNELGLNNAKEGKEHGEGCRVKADRELLTRGAEGLEGTII